MASELFACLKQRKYYINSDLEDIIEDSNPTPSSSYSAIS